MCRNVMVSEILKLGMFTSSSSSVCFNQHVTHCSATVPLVIETVPWPGFLGADWTSHKQAQPENKKKRQRINIHWPVLSRVDELGVTVHVNNSWYSAEEVGKAWVRAHPCLHSKAFSETNKTPNKTQQWYPSESMPVIVSVIFLIKQQS